MLSHLSLTRLKPRRSTFKKHVPVFTSRYCCQFHATQNTGNSGKATSPRQCPPGLSLCHTSAAQPFSGQPLHNRDRCAHPSNNQTLLNLPAFAHLRSSGVMVSWGTSAPCRSLFII